MSNKYFWNKLFLGIGILTFSFSVFLTIKTLQSESENQTLSFISLIVFFWLSYLLIAPSLIRIQYKKSNQGINVLIGNEKQLIIKNTINGKTQVINSEQIKTVELYYSWNTNPFSSDLGYSKITLNDSSNIFIIQDKLPQVEIKRLFRKKITREKSRFMNKLK